MLGMMTSAPPCAGHPLWQLPEARPARMALRGEPGEVGMSSHCPLLLGRRQGCSERETEARVLADGRWDSSPGPAPRRGRRTFLQECQGGVPTALLEEL